MSTTTLTVDGLTCGHCVQHVTTELSALDGVSAVDVDLVAGGTSTVRVTSEGPLAKEALEALCEMVHAEPVQCIGRRFVLYRRSRQPKIELP